MIDWLNDDDTLLKNTSFDVKKKLYLFQHKYLLLKLKWFILLISVNFRFSLISPNPFFRCVLCIFLVFVFCSVKWYWCLPLKCRFRLVICSVKIYVLLNVPLNSIFRWTFYSVKPFILFNSIFRWTLYSVETFIPLNFIFR